MSQHKGVNSFSRQNIFYVHPVLVPAGLRHYM